MCQGKTYGNNCGEQCHESSMVIAFSLHFLQCVKARHTVTTVESSVVGVKTLLPVTYSMVTALLVVETSYPRCAKVISLRMTHASGQISNEL